MIRAGTNFSVPLGPHHALGISCECFRQDFQSNIAPELGIRCAVNLTNSTRTNGNENFVGP